MPFRRPGDDGPAPQWPMPDRDDPPRTSEAVRAALQSEYDAAPSKPAGGEVTPQDIEFEHVNALAALTPEQASAVARLNRAFRESHLGNCSAKEALARVYAAEAAERNRERAESKSADRAAAP